MIRELKDVYAGLFDEDTDERPEWNLDVNSIREVNTSPTPLSSHLSRSSSSALPNLLILTPWSPIVPNRSHLLASPPPSDLKLYSHKHHLVSASLINLVYFIGRKTIQISNCYTKSTNVSLLHLQSKCISLFSSRATNRVVFEDGACSSGFACCRR